jgi:hypothetical protein
MSKFEPQGEGDRSRVIDEIFAEAIDTKFGEHVGTSEHERAGLN